VNFPHCHQNHKHVKDNHDSKRDRKGVQDKQLFGNVASEAGISITVIIIDKITYQYIHRHHYGWNEKTVENIPDKLFFYVMNV
jgi:hypothetical protein